jgi:beta-glucanase (GH16 family)
MDGQPYATYNNPHNGWRNWPFDKKFYIILNVAIGGTWGGSHGVDMNIFPSNMDVDWVRVYREGCN